MGVTDELKGILSIKIKPRQDAYSDQFSRVLLLKVMLVGSFFTGLSWYNDKIECIIPMDGPAPLLDPHFVSQSCWVNGLYIFEEIRDHRNELGYYGLPRKINLDGRLENGALCQSKRAGSRKVMNPGCTPMQKTFFVQFQYMVFFMMALAFLYYLPYILFRYINSDMASLKFSIKASSDEEIVNNYFNHRVNSTSRLNSRLIGNVLCKVSYVVVNVVGFIMTDKVLNGRFKNYGTDWIKWSRLNNTMAYDYMGRRGSPKPGEALLPSFALCEVYEMAKDIKSQIRNEHKYVCELSQHILYQYVLMMMWWMMILGICVSIVGVFIMFADNVLTMVSMKRIIHRRCASKLTVRECEYLSYIQRKDMALFGRVIGKLKTDDNGNDDNSQDFAAEEEPSAPDYLIKRNSYET